MKGQSQDFKKNSKATLKEPLKDVFLFFGCITTIQLVNVIFIP